MSPLSDVTGVNAGGGGYLGAGSFLDLEKKKRKKQRRKETRMHQTLRGWIMLKLTSLCLYLCPC